jgi:hypothetical protein
MCRYMEIVLEDILKEHNWTMHNYDDIMQKVNKTVVTGAIFIVDFITSGSVVRYVILSYLFFQCCGSGIFIPVPIFSISDLDSDQ